jgi:hypothetical protein
MGLGETGIGRVGGEETAQVGFVVERRLQDVVQRDFVSRRER